jgi:hypothetical protein
VSKFLRFSALLALPVTLALEACGGQMSPATPSQSMTSMTTAPRSAAAAPTAPADCSGQSSTTLYATASNESFSDTAPRALCIPEFNGWGGTLKYPAVSASISGVTSTSSTTNYTGHLPTLTNSDAKPIFFLQFTTSTPTNFGPKVHDNDGGLTSKALVPGKTYYVRAQAVFGSGGIIQPIIPFTPCQEKATAGPHGGVLSHIGDIFANQDYSWSNGTTTIVIFRRGKGITQPC